MPRQIVKVNCGNCHACCGDLIMLRPDHGDDVSRYDAEKIVLSGAGAGWALKKKADGTCVHLDSDKGCTVWPNHPFACRMFDCAAYFRRPLHKE